MDNNENFYVWDYNYQLSDIDRFKYGLLLSSEFRYKINITKI